MSKKYLFILSALIILFSITSCNSSVIATNNQNLHHLKKGMTKSEVLSIMGKPLENEVYNTANTWYYFTEVKWSDGYITRDECTPVFFKDGKLAGWGQKEYKKSRQQRW